MSSTAHPLRLRRVLLGVLAAAGVAYALRLLGLDGIPPFAWVRMPWLIGLLGVAVGYSRFYRAGWVAAITAWAVVLLVSGTPLTGWLLQPLIRADPPQAVDAVAVLSVNIRNDGEPDDPTQNHLDRAYELLRAGYARRLVLTNLAVRGISYVPAVRRQLRERKLACEVFETEPITSTFGEIHGIRKIAAKRRWRRVMVVTDACHLKRTRALCRKAGLDALLIPSRHKYYDWPSPHGARPRLAAFRDWAYETYHYQENRVQGRL